MCGISGIVSNNNIDLRSISQMNAIIKHRGPDDEGFVLFNEANCWVAGGNDTATETWQATENYCPQIHIDNVNENVHVALGHRRLSILDLSPKGHQPMCAEDKRYWITYNGEVYNYIEIRKELEALGHQFYTNTDTEVIIHAYIEWGIDCQNKFNGMWAFAIYDQQTKTIFLSRDRFGIKPLYYWFNPNGDFCFASEIKQFTVLPNWVATGNKQRILDYLFYSTADHTLETMFAGVYQLRPGHFISSNSLTNLSTGNHHNLQINWYQFKKNKFNGTFKDACYLFKDYFNKAVNSHLIADVPVGSALSGGLDSSAVVCTISKELKEKNSGSLQKTFSAISDNEKFSEKKWMDAVIDETNVTPFFVNPNAKDLLKQIENITWHMDEPFQSLSAFLSYNVYKKAKEENVLVLLNGQGADEYISGYGLFETLLLKKYLKQINGFQFLKSFKAKHGNDYAALIKYFIPYKLIRTLLGKNRINKNIANLLSNNITYNQYNHPYDELEYYHNSVSAVTHFQLLHDPLPRYLHWEDRNSMAHSVEARVPFLDYRLVEFTRSLPLSFLVNIGQPKNILVKALQGVLPDKISTRKDKMGYTTPEEHWFINEYPDDFIELFNKFSEGLDFIFNNKKVMTFLKDVQSGNIAFSHDYWRLIHVAIWMKIFKIEAIR